MLLPRNRVVWISGASSGIGRATALAFAGDGARVGLAARRAERLHELKREIEQAGGQAVVARCDVSRRDEVRESLLKTAAEFGALHIVINNAGYGHYAPVEAINEDDLDRILRTNVYSALYAAQAALPLLRKTPGSQIINVTSILAFTSIPYAAAYCMSKHALHALTEIMRIELAPHGIRVIEVAPGLTRTEFQRAAKTTGIGEKVVRDNQGGWPPEKVARAILKASRRASREVRLTLEGKLFCFLHDHLPGLVDWGLARWSRRLHNRK